ncbi:MAG TPA: DinB family protein [Rhodopila sp.]|nr:DinB family protein [Rhodopila sp.]
MTGIVEDIMPDDTMLRERFDELATYNRWANRRVYDDAATLSDEVRKRPIGLFFSSIHGTLNHMLVADYIWMRRFIGEGPQPERLNQILYDDFAALRAAREAEDERIFSFVTSVPDLQRDIEYQNSSGRTFRQGLAPALNHFFNHQAHHRGQIHAGMTIVGIREPTSLDLLGLQRSAA